MEYEVFVTIREADNNKAKGNGWIDFKIDDKNVNFLQAPLLKTLRASMKKVDSTCTYWSLCFFSGSEFEVDLFVTLSQTKLDKKNAISIAIWQSLEGMEAPAQAVLNSASQWLRGSNTLCIDAYQQRNNRYLALDGNGLSMISEAHAQSTFERSVLLLALATAYQIRMEALTNELASWGGCNKELAQLSEKASKFNAMFYFRHPAVLKGVELPIVWDEIAKRMRINEQDLELNEQLRALHQIINEKHRNATNNRWQIISLALGIISAVQVLGLLPETLRNSWFYQLTGLLP